MRPPFAYETVFWGTQKVVRIFGFAKNLTTLLPMATKPVSRWEKAKLFLTAASCDPLYLWRVSEKLVGMDNWPEGLV
jgi:hypothetical protein